MDYYILYIIYVLIIAVNYSNVIYMHDKKNVIFINIIRCSQDFCGPKLGDISKRAQSFSISHHDKVIIDLGGVCSGIRIRK